MEGRRTTGGDQVVADAGGTLEMGSTVSEDDEGSSGCCWMCWGDRELIPGWMVARERKELLMMKAGWNCGVKLLLWEEEERD